TPLCRTDRFLTPELTRKIALHCNLDGDSVITAKDVDTIYEVPLVFKNEGLDELIIKKLSLNTAPPDLKTWNDVVRKIKEPENRVAIALVGKYIDLKDSYKSLIEAISHGGIANNVGVGIHWVDSEDIEKHGPEKYLSDVDGILVPGGFGPRGIKGKIEAIRFAREKLIPFFGICLGMQCAVIEFARNVCNLKNANSTEFDARTPYPVIYLMEEWYDFRTKTIQKRDITSERGGTMRLGAYPCVLSEDSFAYEAYGVEEISERHRHRYEFNNAFKEIFVRKGLRISGLSPDSQLAEIVEIKGHPWFLGCQFHPEFKSRPLEPHPLFKAFIGAAYKEKKIHFTHTAVKGSEHEGVK
ncbi:MAG TPA: CTP synthase, partial [Nitrospiraceae bacterium]|nr:CTP synthase [Nitrospiraceae bacterium]